MKSDRTQHAESAAARERPWMSTAGSGIPDEGVVVETKIDDEHGCRNEQTLKRIGSLWFYPDGSMYVYYRPTHWRLRDDQAQG